MQHTIESFIRTLQEDGIAAGKAAGEQARLEAEAAAQKIIVEAREKAAQLLADAEQERQTAALRQTQNLQLAARDAVLELQQRLCRAVESIIDERAAALLQNNDYLSQFIGRVVTAYAEQQVQHSAEAIIFKVAGEDAQRIVQAVVAAVAARDNRTDNHVFKVESGLADLGFEYRQGGNAVEVTPQTVVALLAPLVSEEVRVRIEAAIKK